CSGPGTEHANVAEDSRVVVGRGQRLAAAHRKPGDGAAVLVRDDAVILLDEGDDVLHETFRERARIRLRRSASARWTAGTRRSWARRASGLQRWRRGCLNGLTRGRRTETEPLRDGLGRVAIGH